MVADCALALGQGPVARLLARLHLRLAAGDRLLPANELRLARVEGLRLLGELGPELLALAIGVAQLAEPGLHLVGALAGERLAGGQPGLQLGEALPLLAEVRELLGEACLA